ncbi:MAG: iron-sulfur cluster assembly accessory protein [Rhodocyclaceae bacterium]|nr:iron-sulfur cluster assembly accessory protein [Rhodocyclaceae bacterium]MDZ4215662.1 iron-sulfur cluster assembly accessory protein [Rhodocyclaceae bacterium]
MFTLTPAAAEQIRQAADGQPDIPNEAPTLRIAAKLEEGEIVYGMGFDEERENDIVLETEGVTLLIAPRSQLLLEGAVLDFVELKPGEFQFIFVNPNEPAYCGSQSPGNQGGCGSCGNRSNSCN